MAEQQEEVRQGLSDKISDLENFYADSVLGDELKELYKIFDSNLILNFDEKYPLIVIYDEYIE